MKSRGRNCFLFETLQKDPHQIIFSHLSKDDLMMLRRVNFGGRTQIDAYLSRILKSNKSLLGFLAGLQRSEIAQFLRSNYADKSFRCKALKKAVLVEKPCLFAYAVYAFVANVTTLDADKLLAAIKFLRADGCPERIITTLDIIHFYLTHAQTSSGKELSDVINAAGDTYINLRGATIINSFWGVDLTFADFRETHFSAYLAVLSMAGADVSHATFNARTKLISVDTREMVVDGLILANDYVIDYQYGNRNQLAIPELAPAVAARKKAQERAERQCNIL